MQAKVTMNKNSSQAISTKNYALNTYKTKKLTEASANVPVYNKCLMSST